MRILATLRLDPARTKLISGFVDTYLRLNRQEEQVFQAEIGKLETTEREGVMEIVTSWMEQGIQAGIAQEAKSFVLRLLNRKFGEVPASVRSQIDALSIAQLEALGEALLDFTHPEELTAWLTDDQAS